MDDLSISCTSRGGITVVHVEGEVDVYTSPALREALDEQVNQGRTRLVVDLLGVSFMDSSGLNVLVGGLKSARSRNGSFRLVCTSERILRVLNITGLNQLFEVCSSVAEACEAA